MSTREKLLAGAKQCLVERGYARTTARDVAAASGANLASIGYHFGSMEALLTTAMIQGVGDWGASFEHVLAAEGSVDPETRWTQIIASFEAHRPMLLASFEAFTQSEHLPEVRERIAAAYEDARAGLGALFLDGAELGDDAVRGAGAVSLAMLTGLMAQWLVDPARAPTGKDVAAGLRALGRAH